MPQRPRAEGRLERALGREIRLANDANCFALSEAIDGAARGAPTVFGVILGTGVGGGIVVHGHVLEGANSIAGEWGHNALPSPTAGEIPGAACYCGRTGCIETFLSGPGLARDHAAETGEDLAADADRRAGGGRGRGGVRDAAALRGAPRPRPRLGRQRARSARDRSRRRPVEHRAPVRQRAASCWARWIFSDVVRTRLVRELPRRFERRARRGAALGKWMIAKILSAGVVPLRRTSRGWRMLVLRAYKNWDFPKGLVEEGRRPDRRGQARSDRGDRSRRSRFQIRRELSRDRTLRQQQGRALLPGGHDGGGHQAADLPRARPARASRVALGERERGRGPAAAAARADSRLGAGDAGRVRLGTSKWIPAYAGTTTV